MLKHSFSLYIRREPEGNSLSYGFGCSNPEYAMLHHLVINTHLPGVDDILLNLSRVMDRTQEDFLWGADWSVITSRHTTSTIEYYDHGDPNFRKNPLFIEIPTAWFVPTMRDWRQFLALNPRTLYERTPKYPYFTPPPVHQKMIYYLFSIKPVRLSDKSELIYHLRVNHPDYEMDMFNDLVWCNQLSAIDAVLEQLSKVIEKKQETYVWGQKNLKLRSHVEHTEIEYPFPETDQPVCKTIPTKWLWTMMWDWRLFLELNPKTAYLEKPKSKRAAKKK